MQSSIVDNVVDVVELPRAVKRIRIDQENGKKNEKIRKPTGESPIQKDPMTREVFDSGLHTSENGEPPHHARLPG